MPFQRNTLTAHLCTWVLTLLAIFTLPEGLSATDRVGNGSDPLEFLFGRTRAKAVALVREAKLLSLDSNNNLDNWILQNHSALAEDIEASPHRWLRDAKDDAQETCAWTKPEAKAEITFLAAACRRQGFVFLGDVDAESQAKVVKHLISYLSGPDNSINKLLDREVSLAVMTLIHESVHHLRGSTHDQDASEEAFANQVAERIWSAWHPVSLQTLQGSQRSVEPLMGFYRHQYGSSWVDPVQLSSFPDGSILLSGILIYGNYVVAKLDRRANLPGNVYIFETEVADPQRSCPQKYAIKMYVVSPTEYYLERYFPDIVGATANNECFARGYRWRPWISSFKHAPDGIQVSVEVSDSGSDSSFLEVSSTFVRLRYSSSRDEFVDDQSLVSLVLSGVEQDPIPHEKIKKFSLDNLIGKDYRIGLKAKKYPYGDYVFQKYTTIHVEHGKIYKVKFW